MEINSSQTPVVPATSSHVCGVYPCHIFTAGQLHLVSPAEANERWGEARLAHEVRSSCRRRIGHIAIIGFELWTRRILCCYASLMAFDRLRLEIESGMHGKSAGSCQNELSVGKLKFINTLLGLVSDAAGVESGKCSYHGNYHNYLESCAWYSIEYRYTPFGARPSTSDDILHSVYSYAILRSSVCMVGVSHCLPLSRTSA
jgi:hypothetical protein